MPRQKGLSLVQDPVDRLSSSLRSSQMLRLFSIGFLVLLLLIPIGMINRLVGERQERRQSVIGDVTSKWGNAQTITGPALVVPYVVRWAETGANNQTISRSETRVATFLPESLRARGAITSETRQRGIFSVPLYQLDLTLEGEFARPDLAALGIESTEILWHRAQLAVGIADARAIQQETAVTWDDETISFLPGTGEFAEGGVGIHARLDLSKPAERHAFSFPLTLNGSLALYFTPFGQQTDVELYANSESPSFQGNWLPVEREIEKDRFTARWSIPFLGRNYPQAWTRADAGDALGNAIAGSRFGVDFVSPVDHYRMAERSVKYAGLFILLTFATVWLVEVLAGLRVHPIQYLLLGGALCLFYLLELSLAEHLGFPVAYALASTAIVAMIGGYAKVVLQQVSRSAVVAAGVAGLYAYLYVLLNNEDYALVIGSIGLFGILGAIMFATRRVDWYAVGRG
jgi:inner membrane protein